MFTALGYFGEFLDWRNWRYKYNYSVLTEPRLQSAGKNGRKYQVLSRVQKRKK